jgi:hypothetical protein
VHNWATPFLRDINTGSWPSRLGESRIWDSKIGHDFRATWTRECLRWQEPATIVNDRSILSSESMLHKDYDRKCSVEKELVMSLKGLVTKTNWLAVNRQSKSNSDSDSDLFYFKGFGQRFRWPLKLTQNRGLSPIEWLVFWNQISTRRSAVLTEIGGVFPQSLYISAGTVH